MGQAGCLREGDDTASSLLHGTPDRDDRYALGYTRVIMNSLTAPVWGHINVNCTNLERSIKFYELLGFVVYVDSIPYLPWQRQGAESTDTDEELATALGIPVANTAASAAKTCIMHHPDAPWPKIDLTEWVGDAGSTKSTAHEYSANAGIVRICLASASVDKDYELLTSNGFECLSAPIARLGGSFKVFVAKDPDGVMIEIIELPKKDRTKRARL